MAHPKMMNNFTPRAQQVLALARKRRLIDSITITWEQSICSSG